MNECLCVCVCLVLKYLPENALLTNTCCPCISFSVQQEEQTIHPSFSKTCQHELSTVFKVCVCVCVCDAIWSSKLGNDFYMSHDFCNSKIPPKINKNHKLILSLWLSFEFHKNPFLQNIIHIVHFLRHQLSDLEPLCAFLRCW